MFLILYILQKDYALFTQKYGATLLDTEQVLIEKFGPLLTLQQVATLLDRSKEGLRLTIRGANPLGCQLMEARVKIGRRVHFKVAAIARVIDGTAI